METFDIQFKYLIKGKVNVLVSSHQLDINQLIKKKAKNKWDKKHIQSDFA